MSKHEPNAFNNPTSKFMSKYARQRHKKAARMLGFALTLDSSYGWHAFRYSIGVQLSDHERAALALMALGSLTEEHSFAVFEKCINQAGTPIPPFLNCMGEAAFWADLSNQSELAAYCLASFKAMSAARQRDFLAFVSPKVAA